MNLVDEWNKTTKLINLILVAGFKALQEGLDKYKDNSFDPKNPYKNYNEKNAYFDGANDICLATFWKSEHYGLAELYYEEMLHKITEYEKKNKCNFNKGMLYANLGVSKIAQNKIDDGFTHILLAYEEDEPYHKIGTKKSVFELPQYILFEKLIIKNTKFLKMYVKQDNSNITDSEILNFVTSLNFDVRIMFVSLMKKISSYIELMKETKNRLTRLHSFLALQDLCLFTEHAIKEKTSESGTLKQLMNNLFSTRSGRERTWKIIYDNKYNLTKSNNITEFESNLGDIILITDLNAQRMLTITAVRNFSAHNIDTQNDNVFSLYEKIFENMLHAILFLNEMGCI